MDFAGYPLIFGGDPTAAYGRQTQGLAKA